MNNTETLIKTFISASNKLALTENQQYQLLGFESAIDLAIPLNSQSERTALELIELADALVKLNGDDSSAIHEFLHSPNIGTGGIPVEQIMTTQGLTAVLSYLRRFTV
jgi:hypothetical protein